MELRLNTSCNLPKKMTTERPGKAGESGDDVLCTLAIKGVRVQRDQMDELSGWPIGVTSHLYDELGAPYQHTSFLLPKRQLLFVGTIEARKESGATTAELKLKKALVSSMRFSLDTPDDQGPTAVMSFTLQWKADGDEGEDVRHLLRDRCYLDGKFADEPQKPLQLSSPASPKAEAAAGHRAALERQAAADAGTGRGADDEVYDKARELAKAHPGKIPISWLQRQLKVGYNRAAHLVEAIERERSITEAQGSDPGPAPTRSTPRGDVVVQLRPKMDRKRAAAGEREEDNEPEAPVQPEAPAAKAAAKKKGGGLAQLEKDAAEVARKHPRRDPPKKNDKPRGGSKRHH